MTRTTPLPTSATNTSPLATATPPRRPNRAMSQRPSARGSSDGVALPQLLESAASVVDASASATTTLVDSDAYTRPAPNTMPEMLTLAPKATATVVTTPVQVTPYRIVPPHTIHATVRHSTPQHSTARHSMPQHATPQTHRRLRRRQRPPAHAALTHLPSGSSSAVPLCRCPTPAAASRLATEPWRWGR